MWLASENVSVRASQDGVGLIEVLIAMLVLAAGILGLVRMQLAAKQASFEATQRTLATSLSRDLLERMRSNPRQLNGYVVNELGASSSPPAYVNCTPTVCSPAQLARYDIYDWYLSLRGAAASVTVEGRTANAAGLIEPRACVSNHSGNVAVAIAWRGVNRMETPDDANGDFGSDCGLSGGLYGDGDRQRRLLVMSTFIGES